MGGGTGPDIRIPIGLMFLVIGLIITLYGIRTVGNAMYATHSLGIDINLWWGLILIAFSAIMLGLAWNAAQKHKKT